MSQRNEIVDLCIDELERYGLRGEVSDRTKHIEIAWHAPQGRRFIIVPKTASDWRSGLNSRSDMRKMLRSDNLHPRQITEQTYHKAMSLPKPIIINKEQALQRDVDALVELMFDLQSKLSEMQEQHTALQDKMNSITVVSKVQFGPPQNDGGAVVEVQRKVYQATSDGPGFRFGTKSDMVLSMMTAQFGPVADLYKKLGLSRAHVSNILQKAKKRGLVESGLRGQWRKIV